MNSNYLDLEHLQQLTYERSKMWSSFLDQVSKKEDLEEIDITSFDDLQYEDENNTDDELASMEDDECDDLSFDSDILRNASNTSAVSLIFNNSKNVDIQKSSNVEANKLLDMFNQTLPIINEHNRQLKESGFEEILSTFDTQQIENKVGSWLNRHNSLYINDNTMLGATSKKDFKNRCYNSMRRIGKNASDDSDDSLQSGETARYIRSSRAGAIKNSSSTTTMIKTYRRVKSTREALREKYACEMADDEYFLNSLRSRRKFAFDYHHNYYDLTRKNKIQQLYPLENIERRKVLRKRTYSNSCSAVDNSSDSDNYYYERNQHYHRKHLMPCCKKIHCSPIHIKYPLRTPINTVVKQRPQRNAIIMPSVQMNRMYYYSQVNSLSTSSSSASFSSVCERRVKKNSNFYGDNIPRKRESECHCCNERKLCDNYKHVSDSSTDEWFVQNSCSPKKKLKTPTSQSKPELKSIELSANKLSAVTELVNEEVESKRNLRTKKSKNETNKSKEKPKPKKSNLKSQTAKTGSNSKAPLSPAINDETFNRELQLAIAASKKSYEKEQQMKQKSLNTKENHEVMPTKHLRKTNKTQEESKDKNETIPKKQYINVTNELNENVPKLMKDKSDIKIQLIDSDSEDDFTKPEPLSDKLSVAKTKNAATVIKPEETFFEPSQTQAIYNSTALSKKSQAFNRQIAEKLDCLNEDEGEEKDLKYDSDSKTKKSTTKRIKTKNNKTTEALTMSSASKSIKNKVTVKQVEGNCSTVTSTTIRSPDLHFSVNTPKTLTEKTTPTIDNKNLSDCTLVTLTTNIEPQPAAPTTTAAIQEPIADSQQQKDISSSSLHRHTQKGIVIYAPEHRSMAPAYSFTSDGYFTITKELLSSVIGEKAAKKFLRYYIGRKRFNSNSTVYFIPPLSRTLDDISTSSDSDDDLDYLGQYGDLYESLNKTTKKP